MNIFVGNLGSSVTTDDLRRAFAGYGTVIKAIVMKDTLSGTPLGYGHVYLVPEEAAHMAIVGLHRSHLKDRPMIVRECIYRIKQDRRASRFPWCGPERRRSLLRRLNGHVAGRNVVRPASFSSGTGAPAYRSPSKDR